MAALTSDTIRKRIEQVKAGLWREEQGQKHANPVQGAVQATISILSVVHGPASPQLGHFQGRLKPDFGRWDNEPEQWSHRIAGEIETVLDSALADVESGLTGSVRVQAKGEILGDFVALAREALESKSEASNRVAAVLVAAAFEETLKQIGVAADVDVYARDMRGVIQKLKDASVLTGAQPGVATGFVKFRDHAFHGQFEQIERATTESALAFVEGLLAARFT